VRAALLLGVLLAGCARSVAPPRAAMVDQPVATETDGDRLLPGVTGTEFIVLRSAAELMALRRRLTLPTLLAAKPVDFRHDLVVGAIGEPSRRERTLGIWRIVYGPEAVDVQVISYPQRERDTPVTPYVFVTIARTDRPVRFWLNDDPAGGEDVHELTPGFHDDMITYRAPYSVYVPAHIERPAPLLVFLHSSTSNGHRWAPNLAGPADRYGFVILAPSARNGYYWTETYDDRAILDAIEEVKLRFPIDPSRIYIAGNSAGGHTVYRFAIQNRDVFAGFASSAGRLNPEVPDSVLERAWGMPALILCGEQDETVPITSVLAGKERLEKAGVRVTFRSYPCGHGVLAPATGALDDMFRWFAALAYGTEEPRVRKP
jgi:predicted esterase